MSTCRQNKVSEPSIVATAALGTTASPYLLSVNITQRLCYSVCVDSVPVFSPVFSLKEITQTSLSNQYLCTIEVSGIISYVRCGGGGGSQCSCCTQQPLSSTFVVPIASATEPSVSIEQGAICTALSASACCDCSRTFVCECPISLTVS